MFQGKYAKREKPFQTFRWQHSSDTTSNKLRSTGKTPKCLVSVTLASVAEVIVKYSSPFEPSCTMKFSFQVLSIHFKTVYMPTYSCMYSKLIISIPNPLCGQCVRSKALDRFCCWSVGVCALLLLFTGTSLFFVSAGCSSAILFVVSCYFKIYIKMGTTNMFVSEKRTVGMFEIVY